MYATGVTMIGHLLWYMTGWKLNTQKLTAKKRGKKKG
jgi:hypothetical protein